MTARDFVDAILDDPDDEMLRLVFADWLEEDGQSARADWVRSVTLQDRVDHDDPRAIAEAWGRSNEFEDRCRPDWWTEMIRVPGIQVTTVHRVLTELTASSASAVEALGRSPMLPRAIEEGWLASVAVVAQEAEVVRALVGWIGPARQVPFKLSLSGPPIGESLMDELTRLPRIIRINLGNPMLNSRGIGRLVDRPELRSLRIDLEMMDYDQVFDDYLDDRTVRAFLKTIVRLDHLHSLVLTGPRPNSADPGFLSQLAGMAGLRALWMIRWRDLTMDAFRNLDRSPSLRQLRLSLCAGFTTKPDLDRLREALPRIEIGLR